ncbi:uncharacterized protein LOC105429814 [Pogonomyrmex barbatus]|uniref:Uncharacterized protein LOC105429814 n=1 Tax=Pogonomyrmex barbatus TaxID=144034 RepID=A0A6I9WFD5_9HYME|nr:uncharacterized protein LOC105429814 [Pogonomyrmex barbatus]
MNFDLYYKLDNDGYYNLHFVNTQKLSTNEIRNIFSAFGRVVGINGTKDESGYKFVKYKTLRETEDCLRGLHHSAIQLLPEKSKLHGLNKNIDKRDLNQSQTTRSNDQKTFNNNKQFDSNSIHNKNDKESLTSEDKRLNSSVGSNYQNFTYGHKSNLIQHEQELDSTIPNDRPSSSRQTFMKNNASNTTIDYEKYYRIGKDGTFSVHFPAKGLEIDQVKEMFSYYGKVLSVQPRGVNNGLMLVKYKTEEEVNRCIDGLWNSKMINILPQKDKINDERKKSDNLNPWQEAKVDTSERHPSSINKEFNSNIHNKKSLGIKEMPIYNHTKTSEENLWDNTDNFSDTGSRSSRQDYKSDTNKHHTGSYMSSNKYSFMKSNSIHNGIQNSECEIREEQQRIQPCSSKYTNTVINTSENAQINTNDKIPMLIADTEMKSKDLDAMSDSSSSNGIRNFSSKISIIPMQEIIVANIPEEYGVHYILHLIEKYSPISATFVKTISESNIRYCRVYLKNIQDAISIEEEFDNFDLAGKSLIVLRKSRLIDEIIYK